MAFFHSFPKILQSAELELLDGPLRPPEGTSDLCDAPLFGKTHGDDAALVGGQLLDETEEAGAMLDRFQVENVSLPEDLQKVLDQRIGMGVVGDMARYTQFQTAQSIPVAAANQGGAAGVGAGLGAGVAIGQTMAAGLASAVQGAKPTAEAAGEVTSAIEKLHELMTKGILTQQEFDAKKTELLKKLG